MNPSLPNSGKGDNVKPVLTTPSGQMTPISATSSTSSTGSVNNTDTVSSLKVKSQNLVEIHSRFP